MNLIVLGDLIVNTDRIEYVRYIGHDEFRIYFYGAIKYTTIERETFEELKGKIIQRQSENSYKQKFEKEQRENQILLTHISLMPGGTEYLAAQTRFENTTQ